MDPEFLYSHWDYFWRRFFRTKERIRRTNNKSWFYYSSYIIYTSFKSLSLKHWMMNRSTFKLVNHEEDVTTKILWQMALGKIQIPTYGNYVFHSSKNHSIYQYKALFRAILSFRWCGTLDLYESKRRKEEKEERKKMYKRKIV